MRRRPRGCEAGGARAPTTLPPPRGRRVGAPPLSALAPLRAGRTPLLPLAARAAVR